MLKKQRAQLVLERLNKLYPETPVPLNHSNHFELLVAVLLSAQCTDERVNQVTLLSLPWEIQLQICNMLMLKKFTK